MTEVFLGNKSLGEAPLIDFPLPAGTHTLKLVNSTDGTKVEIVVEIVAGKTTFKKLRLNQ